MEPGILADVGHRKVTDGAQPCVHGGVRLPAGGYPRKQQVVVVGWARGVAPGAGRSVWEQRLQNLHVVGVTNDRRSLILTSRQGAASGSFVLAIDDHLLGLVNRLASRTEPVTSTSRPPEEPEPDRVRAQLRSRLSPREIQARLRAGYSLEEVAAEAGVEESWVERFAAPVLAEREQVIARARELVYSRPRAGASAMDLGDSVRTKLEARGIRLLEDVFEAAWSAQHVESSRWIVHVRFEEGGEEQVAEWEVDFAEGSLVGLDKASAALAYVSKSDQPKAQDESEPEAPARRRSASPGPTSKAKKAVGARAKSPSSSSPATDADTDLAPVRKGRIPVPRRMPGPTRRSPTSTPPAVPTSPPPASPAPASAGRSGSTRSNPAPSARRLPAGPLPSARPAPGQLAARPALAQPAAPARPAPGARLVGSRSARPAQTAARPAQTAARPAQTAARPVQTAARPVQT
ncbi:MAG: septation protein SepH, partial [Acidimicrobiales bacterium]